MLWEAMSAVVFVMSVGGVRDMRPPAFSPGFYNPKRVVSLSSGPF